MAKFPRELITVTPLSIGLSVVCFIFFVILAFYLGVQYQKVQNTRSLEQINTNPIVASSNNTNNVETDELSPSLSAGISETSGPAKKTKELTIKDFLTYQVPQNWVEEPVEYSTIMLHSSDYKNAIYDPDQGIRIALYTDGTPTSKTLEQYASTDRAPIPDAIYSEWKTTATSIGNVLSRHICYEGCDKEYMFKYMGKVWRFSFDCARICDTNEKVEKNYGVLLNNFLQSLSIKES